MSELKKCPFCGWEFAEHAWNEFGEEYRVCDQCGATSGTVNSMWDWNNRPIEDALNARIAELEAVIEILEDQQREAKNHLIDKNLHIDSLYEEGYKLQQRIAELEAYIDQLTARWRQERQDDKWIPEVQE